MFGLLYRVIFSLPPAAYFVIACLFVLAGGGGYFSVRADNAASLAALHRGAPALIDIEQYKAKGSDDNYNEIAIRAQLNASGIVESVESKNHEEVGRKTFLPIFPVSAVSPNAPASAVVIIEGKVTDEQIKALLVSNGKFGPIIQIDGLIEKYAATDQKEAEEALARSTKLLPDFMVIKPFMHGRVKDLTPDPDSPLTLLIGMLIIAFLIALYGLFRKKYKDTSSGYLDTSSGYQP